MFNCILNIVTRDAAYRRPSNDHDDDDRRWSRRWWSEWPSFCQQCIFRAKRKL